MPNTALRSPNQGKILLIEYLQQLILSSNHIAPNADLLSILKHEVAILRRGYPGRWNDLEALRTSIASIDRDTKVHFHMPNGRSVLTAIKVYRDERLSLITLPANGVVCKITSKVRVLPPGSNNKRSNTPTVLTSTDL